MSDATLAQLERFIRKIAQKFPSVEEPSIADAEKVLMTVLTRREAALLRNFIRKEDPHAFITIVNSSEIIGKGFRGFN